ncbi:MAG: hypothetical protein AB7O38_25980 [Pirellulaceae bacterium]
MPFARIEGPIPGMTETEIGFIQFQRIKEQQFLYAGAKPDHGQVHLIISAAPAMPQTLALDSDNQFSPWTKPAGPQRMTVAPFGGIATSITGDHPMVKVPLRIDNKVRFRENFLVTLIDHREYFTLFSVRQGQGGFDHLAFFHWTLHFTASLQWSGGSLVRVDSFGSKFDMGSVQPGVPLSPGLGKLLVSPRGPQANTIMRMALDAAVENGIRTPNRKDDDFWGPLVPAGAIF